MSEKQNKVLGLIMSCLLVVSMWVLAAEAAAYRESLQAESEEAVKTAGTAEGVRPRKKEQFCVVIDAGHGGSDPGKVSETGVGEKDLNLRIACRLQALLEANDVRVVMTRETDAGLYDETAEAKKTQDMKRRVAIITEEAPALAVSIHQNSYPQESIKGAQVFYYKTSPEGKKLAETVQQRLIDRVDSTNTRQSKANDTYYLLKKTQVPVIIVECGFLSNREETELLCSETYQEKLAWAIHLGILQYLNSNESLERNGDESLEHYGTLPKTVL